MIEVMIALTILAIAITAILSNYHVLNTVRQDTAARGAVSELGRAILDRITAGDMRALGVLSPAGSGVAQPWSLMRSEDLPLLRPPMTQGAADPANDLVALGLIPGPMPVTDLQVFIEYFRGVNVIDLTTGIVQLSGVLDENYLERGDFREAFTDPDWRTARRLAGNAPPIVQVADDDPIVIRVILTWGINQRLEFFTTKRRPPGV